MKTTATKDKPILLSKKGMKELKKLVATLEHDRIKSLSELRELDKTSNHESRLNYLEKLAQIDIVEARLEEKKFLLKSARPLPTKRARMRVAIGSVVDLIDQHGRMFRYMLVDTAEADPSDGRISIASPLGKNLLGKTVQDIVEWSAGLTPKRLQLVHIA